MTLLDPALVKPALRAAFAKLNPRVQLANPVMFVVYMGSHRDHAAGLQGLQGQGEAPQVHPGLAVWLWFTVLFANFAEALAEGRSKAQAASLRTLKKDTWAKRYTAHARPATMPPRPWLPARRRAAPRRRGAGGGGRAMIPPTAR
jgi:K+-transporting ATPase ATPase B chain